MIRLHLTWLRLQCLRHRQHSIVITSLGACCARCGRSWEAMP